MPIVPPPGLKRLSDDAFSKAVYAVMEVIFAIHNEFGRLFDEEIYRREIARRLVHARTQVMLEAAFETFRKAYYLDLLYSDGALFELKTTNAFAERHRAQLLNYLYLLELPHGKLVNLRTELVEHEFVNAPLSRAERISFKVMIDPGGAAKESKWLSDLLVPILRDWGTCLEVGLYEEAVTHFLGGEQSVLKTVDVLSDGKSIGTQEFKLITPDSAFRITAFEGERPQYPMALRLLLEHTALNHLHWINIGRRLVTFKTFSK